MGVQLFQRLSVLVAAFFVIGISANFSLGCLTPGSVIGSFDPDNYVFIGKVKGYTTDAELLGRQQIIRGLEVESTDIVSPITLPFQTIVFPLRRMADCERGGLTKPELEEEYPIGSEIKVIARKANDIKYPATNNLILEAGFVDHTFVAPNPKEKIEGRNNGYHAFDYTKANDSFLSSPQARYYFVAFEVQKDLARLSRSVLSERLLILKRLRLAPNYARINFELIEATYTLNVPTNKF